MYSTSLDITMHNLTNKTHSTDSQSDRTNDKLSDFWLLLMLITEPLVVECLPQNQQPLLPGQMRSGHSAHTRPPLIAPQRDGRRSRTELNTARYRNGPNSLVPIVHTGVQGPSNSRYSRTGNCSFYVPISNVQTMRITCTA